MISSDVIRGYIDTMILHILTEKDSYGYEISHEIELRSFHSYCMKETTLYSAMARMEKKGYLVSYYGNETFGKRRTYYTITQQGLDYYEEKCREWSLTKKVINEFTTEENEDESTAAVRGGHVQFPAQDRTRGQDENEHSG